VRQFHANALSVTATQARVAGGFAVTGAASRLPAILRRADTTNANPLCWLATWHPGIVGAMSDRPAIPTAYRGWWRIVQTGAWVDDGLHILGPAMLGLTGENDRLRLHCLLATVKARPTKAGVSFTWKGSWEFDEMSGTGRVEIGSDGRLHGHIKIRNGDDSTFLAERADPPDEPIPDPPRYRDKWRRRW